MQAELAKASGNAINDYRANFSKAIAESGQFYQQTIKTKSAVAQYTEALTKSDIGLKQAVRSRQLFNDVLREQYQLQKMLTVQWQRDAGGMVTADVVIPRGAETQVDKLTSSLKANVQGVLQAKAALKQYAAGTPEAEAAQAQLTQATDILRMRTLMFNQVLNSVGDNMIKWGKNTQWAGRQLMVGFTVPFAAFAAVAGIAADKVDQQMTRIVKVYDFAATDIKGKEQELATLRQQSMAAGAMAAKQYGVALKDTLDVEAELAATGLQGQQLVKTTSNVVRAATLGELDYADAVKASIAMQTVYKLSAEQVGDAFNYMNSTENATNLTMKDFVTAIPIVSGPLAQLGVTLQQTGVLLAAMKAGGIEANQGANALKTGMADLIKPTDTANKYIMQVSNGLINISKMSQENSGQSFAILTDLATKLKQLEPYVQQQILVQLFGKRQFPRMNAIIQGLGDIHDKTTQVGRAFDVANQSTEQWGATAQGELYQIQNSLSGNFKRSVEALKAELAQMGRPFVEFATMFIHWTTGIIKFFNGLPGIVKTGIVGFMGLMALAGPLIMIAGLLGNLGGQAIKFVTGITMMFTKWRTMTAEQRAAELASKHTSLMWQNQGAAAQALSAQLNRLVESFELLAVAQNPALAATFAANGSTNFSVTKNNRVKNTKTGRIVGSVSAADAAAMRQAEQSAQKIAAESGKSAINWNKIGRAAQGLTFGAAAMSMMVGSSNSLLGNLINAGLAASLIGPGIIRGLKSISGSKASLALKGLDDAFFGASAAAGGGIKGFGAGLKAVLPVAATLGKTILKFAGPAGLLATAAITFMKIRSEISKAKAEQDKLNNSAKDWADILGFVFTEQKKQTDAQGNQVLSIDLIAKKMADANKPLAERMRYLKSINAEQSIINAAIQEGLKVSAHGGSATQAEMAAQTALRMAGFKQSEIQDLMVTIKARVDFSDARSVLDQQMSQFANEFNRIANNKFKQGSFEGLSRLFTGRDQLNTAAREAAKGLASEFWNSWEQADQAGRKTLFDSLAKTIHDSQDKVFNGIDKDAKKKLSELGVNNFSELVTGLKDPNESISIHKIVDSNDISKVLKYADAEGQITKTLIAQDPSLKNKAKNVRTLNELMPQLDQATLSLAEAEQRWKDVQNNPQFLKYTADQKLNILNTLRAAAGKDKATSIEQGFSNAIKSTTDALSNQSDALDSSTMSAEDWANTVAGAAQKAMQGAQSAAFGLADSIWNDAAQAQVDAITKRGQAATDAIDAQADAQDKVFDDRATALETRWKKIDDQFDSSWKDRIQAVKDGYDARIKAVQDSIDAEQKAEDQRQKIFDAEKARFEALANMANQQIDFNLALNQGNFDEAARVFNNIKASQVDLANQGAADASQAASDAKKAAADQQIQALQDERDARIDSLQKVQDAEKEALDAKKQMEQDALDAEKDRYKKAIDAQKKAIQEQTQNDEAAKRKELDRQKRTLDLELDTLRASLPRNKAEYDAQIKKIEEAYAKYGINLKLSGDEWSKYIGDALNSNIKAAADGMASDIAWKQIAADITDKFTQGAFGLTSQEFAQWLTTGKMPDGGLHPGSPTKPGTKPTYVNAAPGRPAIRHAGGPLDNRAGRPFGSPMYSDERLVLAQAGEYIMSAKAHKMLGTGFLNMLNFRHSGGPVGLGGLAVAGLGGMLKNTLLNTILAQGQMPSGAVNIGQVPVVSGLRVSGLSTQQLQNAATILAVGRAMGASQRDLVVAIMTAMQESNLLNVNYGDRDSLGLFQQRPSQGWGTPAQVLNPQYAARKFFEGLLGIADRNSMPLTLEAQAVQRSAFPYAYAKWEPLARSVVATLPGLRTGGTVMFDNTIANLHRNEKVLTAPLSSKLERGIDRIDSGYSNHYDITLDLRGALIDKDVDIEKMVNDAIEKRENKLGRSRRIQN